MTTILETPPTAKDLVANTPITYQVTDPIWAACRWILREADAGNLTQKRAKQVVTAVRSLVRVAQEGEDISVQGIGALVEEFQKRWINKEHGDARSADNYAKKVRDLAADYTDRCVNITTFVPTKRWAKYQADSLRTTRTAAPAVTTANSVAVSEGTPVVPNELNAEPSNSETQAEDDMPKPNTLVIAVGPQQTVTVQLSFDQADLTMAHIRKIVGTLVPSAKDYDFMRLPTEQLANPSPLGTAQMAVAAE